MCIIVAKPRNTQLPTWNTLEKCFKRNPDGAGFMYSHEGVVHIKKGFMTFGEFKKAFREEKKHFDFEKEAVVFHFRIATHGEVSKECCHPFAVSTDLDRLRETEVTARYGCAHNGIIYGRNTNNRKSDSMDYIMNIVAPLARLTRTDLCRDKYALNILKDTLGNTNKLAIMDGEGNVRLVGAFTEDKGVYYSNTTYKYPKVTTSYYGTGTYASGYGSSSYPYYKSAGTTSTSTAKYFPLSKKEDKPQVTVTTNEKKVRDKMLPNYPSCEGCPWRHACEREGAECVCEDDAAVMRDILKEQGTTELWSDTIWGEGYDYTKWEGMGW